MRLQQLLLLLRVACWLGCASALLPQRCHVGPRHVDLLAVRRTAPDDRPLAFKPDTDVRVDALDAANSFTRDAWLAHVGFAGMAALLLPSVASASFGSAGGAVTSMPPSKPLTLDEIKKLSDSKFAQVEGTLGPKVIDEYLLQSGEQVTKLDKLLQELQELTLPQDWEETRGDMLKQFTDLREALDKERKLQEDLRFRQRLLTKLDQQPSWFRFAAAFAASLISTLIMHPVDTIKTKMIAGSDTADVEEEGQGESGLAWLTSNLPDLYIGITGNLLKEGPSSALYLGVYETVKTSLLETSLASEPLLIYLLAGAAGELCGTVIRVPAESIKASVQSGRDESMAASVERIFGSAEGRQTVLSAWVASLYRDIPMGAIQIALFEGLKVYIINDPNINFNVNTLWAEALLGAFGGAVAAFLTTPPDVVTTRIITGTERGGGEDRSVGVVAGEVWAEDGLAAIFTGWRQRSIYWAPAIGIFLSCYCLIRRFAATQDLF